MPGKEEGCEMLELQNLATRKRLQTHRRERQTRHPKDLSTVPFQADRILLEYGCIDRMSE